VSGAFLLSSGVCPVVLPRGGTDSVDAVCCQIRTTSSFTSIFPSR
jgi:hypothetical protein